MAYAVSPDAKYRMIAVNNDAVTDFYAYRGKSTKPLRLTGSLPGGELQGIRYSPDGRYAAVFVDSDVTPTDIYLVDLKKRNIRQLTDGLNPKIDRSCLVEGEVVKFGSHGDVEISGVLYKPKGASAADPVPALVYAHGGPWGQNRKGYLPAVQYLVNHGYAVLAVNNRGSTGYGKTFFHMDDRHHGDVDLKDMIAARNYLGAQDWVQGDKVGIMGSSYGGYMVMAAMTFAPEEFAVGIDIFGVTNWVRTIDSIPIYWESFRGSFLAEMGDPATDGDRHRAISPLFHSENIRNPVLVVQGANDPRVLQAESDDIVAAVRANGVPAEYVLFPDEGHDFKIRENRITAAEAYLNFLETYIPK
jgi:dipeptidyl aminopeptidase/acylaminoacyl peptidase